MLCKYHPIVLEVQGQASHFEELNMQGESVAINIFISYFIPDYCSKDQLYYFDPRLFFFKF